MQWSCTDATHRVSIHAPARGATTSAPGAARARSGFNPRAREGRDCLHLASLLKLSRFNPRAREGRDRRNACPRVAIGGFNPRAREGRDDRVPRGRNLIPVSIHAPARGATFETDEYEYKWRFQSTRPRGA